MPIPMAVIWLIAVVVFVVAEAATLGLTSIWFACGSLLAMVAALLDVSIWGQRFLPAVCRLCSGHRVPPLEAQCVVRVG